MGDDWVGADDDPLELLGVSGDDDDDDDDDDEVSGDDDEIGAVVRRAKARGVKIRDLRKLKKAWAHHALKKRRASLSMAAKAGNLPQIFLGVDSNDNGGNVAAAAAVNQNSESTVPLRITDLLIDDSVAADFAINRIDIARTNLHANASAIPASAFVTGVQRPPVETPRLEAGVVATILAANRAGAARRFLGMFTAIDLTRAR